MLGNIGRTVRSGMNSSRSWGQGVANEGYGNFARRQGQRAVNYTGRHPYRVGIGGGAAAVGISSYARMNIGPGRADRRRQVGMSSGAMGAPYPSSTGGYA